MHTVIQADQPRGWLLERRVLPQHTDHAGVMWHGAYLAWLEEARVEAYHCKYFADEMAFAAIDRCMQIHGGIALTTDLPIERMWRQQRSYRITEGASEVMRTVIARHVM